MKNKFPGYYYPDKALFDKLFSEALIVFDTNILLDIYRVSPDTSKELMKVIKKLNDRLWIPYQVGLEYHKDLFLVVSGQIKKYREAIKEISSIKTSFAEKRNHPFLPEELYTKTCELFDELTTFFEKQCEILSSFIMEKSIKDDLCEQLNGKIGEGFNQEELEKIYLEGDQRYKLLIPPGFKDCDKPTVAEKFGDLIIWKEIINKAKANQKHIIFVTNDTKKDWFIEFEGKTYGPNPKLIKEFQDLTGLSIYIYTLEKFLGYADKIDIKVTETALEELKVRKKTDLSDISLSDLATCQDTLTEATKMLERHAVGIYDLSQSDSSDYVINMLDRKGSVNKSKTADNSEEVNSELDDSK
jgi:hypothetical protein